MDSRRGEALTDEQGVLIAPLISEPPRREDGCAKSWRGTRAVLNDVLWIYATSLGLSAISF